MKFNERKKEWYPTIKEILEVVPSSTTELNNHFENNTQAWLKRYASTVYEVMYKQHTNNRKESRKCMRYLIYKNKNGERDAILDAVGEIVMSALTSEMDLSVHEHGQIKLPETVYDKLDAADLLLGEFHCAEIPDNAEKYI